MQRKAFVQYKVSQQRSEENLLEAFKKVNFIPGKNGNADLLRKLITKQTVDKQTLFKGKYKEYCHMNCRDDSD